MKSLALALAILQLQPLLLLVLAQTDPPPYQLSITRSQVPPNLVTLECTSVPDGVNSVSFFLNGSVVQFAPTSGLVFSFMMLPSLEGDYTCGVGEEQGPPETLVGE